MFASLTVRKKHFRIDYDDANVTFTGAETTSGSKKSVTTDDQVVEPISTAGVDVINS